MSRIKKYIGAFALMELLIAVAIFAAVITIAYTTLYTGLKTYHRTQAQLRLNQEINQVLDKLSVELRNCYDAEYNTTNEGSGFIASSDSLSFFTIQNSYSENQTRKLLARVAYNFKEGKLFKKLQLDKDAFLDEGNFKEEELLSDIKELNFKYIYAKYPFAGGEPEFEWKTEWPQSDSIPGGVKVEITRYDPESDISLSLERYIFLSQGAMGSESE